MEDTEKEKNETENKNDDNEEVVTFEYNEDGEDDLKKTLKKIRAELKLCKKEKDEYLSGWQKERADFANYKKDEEERRSNLVQSVTERVLAEFLRVADSFDMAFSNREAWERVEENWRKGVEYIYVQMNTIFEEYGIKSIGVVGEHFDPNIHHSIESITTNEKEKDHTVAEVTQKGYKLGERIVRPARVKIFET